MVICPFQAEVCHAVAGALTGESGINPAIPISMDTVHIQACSYPGVPWTLENNVLGSIPTMFGHAQRIFSVI